MDYDILWWVWFVNLCALIIAIFVAVATDVKERWNRVGIFVIYFVGATAFFVFCLVIDWLLGHLTWK